MSIRLDCASGVDGQPIACRNEATAVAARADFLAKNPRRVQSFFDDYYRFLRYALDAKNQISLTYSRRIDRPNYADLNPFENKLDELTYQKGNAFLPNK